MKAAARTLRITPKKLNLIAELVREKGAEEAVQKLNYAPKKGAKLLSKVIKSAIANAKTNFKQDPKNLVIKEVLVSKAATYKRWVPASRGRMHPIQKRNSHLSVTLGVKEDAVVATTEQSTAKSKSKAVKSPAPAKKVATKTTKTSENKEPKKTAPKKETSKNTN